MTLNDDKIEAEETKVNPSCLEQLAAVWHQSDNNMMEQGHPQIWCSKAGSL